MPNIIIRRDRVRVKTSVYLEGYPGRPTWSSRYNGPVWKSSDITEFRTDVRTQFPFNSENFLPGYGYGGFSNVAMTQFKSTLLLETVFDVRCLNNGVDTDCLPDVELVGYSHFDLDTIFTVGNGDVMLGFSGIYPDPADIYSSLKLKVYNLTDGNVLVDSAFGEFTLHNRHVYRIKAHAVSQGKGDPQSLATLSINFRDATVEIPGAPES